MAINPFASTITLICELIKPWHVVDYQTWVIALRNPLLNKRCNGIGGISLFYASPVRKLTMLRHLVDPPVSGNRITRYTFKKR